jgi:hypothetical protein
VPHDRSGRTKGSFIIIILKKGKDAACQKVLRKRNEKKRKEKEKDREMKGQRSTTRK